MSAAGGGLDRAAMVRWLQRLLAPFATAAEVSERLALVEETGVAGPGGAGRGYALVETLNACLFEHPAFFEARERRALDDEERAFARLEAGAPPAPARYRLEARVEVGDAALPDGSVLSLWLPAPRELPGLQAVRLVAAEPAALAGFYLPRAGLIFGAPLLVERGAVLAPLRLVFEVERGGSVDVGGASDMVPRARVAPEAAAWARTVLPEGAAAAPAPVDALVDALERDLQFALTGPTQSPIRTLLAAAAGDVRMHSLLLVDALNSVGIAARLGGAQRLALVDGRSRLRYPGATGFDHVVVEWRDPGRGAHGVVDLSYIGRWSAAATDDNLQDEALRRRLVALGERARVLLRHHPYPLDLVLSGIAPESALRLPASAETHFLHPPVDVELAAERLS